MKEKSTNMKGNIEITGECRKESEIENKSINFTTHNMRFKFAILNGEQPKSTHPFNMKNWTGYRFISDDYIVTSTPKSIVIDVNQTTDAGSIKDLCLKYAELAQAYANNFAQKHDILIGGIQRDGNPNYVIGQ